MLRVLVYVGVVAWLSLGLPCAARAQNCAATSIGLHSSTYVRTDTTTETGVAAASAIEPLDSRGLVDLESGRVVMIGIGMSNANRVGGVLQTKLTNAKAPWVSPLFRYVNGAKDSRTAPEWADDTDRYGAWAHVAKQLMTKNLSALQVQAAHVVMTMKNPRVDGPMTEAHMRDIISILLDRYPNVRVVWLSGISYTGYSLGLPPPDGDRAPEPFVQQDSLLLASLVGTFPVWTDFYDQWSDGKVPNPVTGLAWHCADVIDDGVHPSGVGRTQLANYLIARWRDDPVTEGWMR